MGKKIVRVKLTPDTDLRGIIEKVHLDKTPRLIERDGEAIAVVIDADEYPESLPVPKSRRFKKKLLALAGAWSDLDTDDFKETNDLPKSAAVTDAPPSDEEIRLSREGILKASGSWRDIDINALKTYLRERRKASNRPPVRL